MFQGPALYCYNSAEFAEEDWKGIQRLMRSNKEDKPLKVGRFGIGFNSVYHITDLPSIVSGETVGFLDPHQKYFVRGESGQAYSIDDPDLVENDDQFRPFHDIFGCCLGQNSYFKGTLFRFPLRTAPSELSKKIYTKEKVMGLFKSFRTESSIILHFLKNIESISLYTREDHGPITQKYCVRLSDSCKAEVRARRSELTANITSEWDYTPVSVFYTLKVEEVCEEELQQTRDWYMACQVGTTEDKLISLAAELQLLPWIGVAYPVDVDQVTFHSGRIFCFLPLPPDDDIKTGLPIQVNGYFGLTDNRRSLKWSGGDCQNDDTAEWNELLLRTLGVNVYVSLIEKMTQLFSSKSVGSSEMLTYASLVYSAIPRACDVKESWKCILDGFFIQVLQRDIFYTAARGKAGWFSLDKVVLDRLDQSDVQMNEVVRSTLLRLGQPVVTAPPHVLEMIDSYSGKSGFSNARQITPQFLRDVLSHNNDWLSMATEEKLLLLQYVLQDSQFDKLTGIALLPLENGKFEVFQNFRPSFSNDTTKVYMTNYEHPVDLFPNAQHRLLNESLAPNLKEKLTQLTSQQSSNSGVTPTQLFRLTKQDVLKLLRQTFPEEWSTDNKPVQQVVPWRPGETGHPPLSWLQSMWQWIHQQFPDSLQMLENIPLIPLSSGSVLVRLSRQSKMIFAKGTAYSDVLTSSLRQLLEACGCIIVEDPPPYLSHVHLVNYISPPTSQGVLNLLMTTGIDRVLQALQTSSHDTRSQLRRCLATLTTLTTEQMSFVRSLPVFMSVDHKHFLSCCTNNNGLLPVAAPNFSLPSGTRVVDQSKIISSSDEESAGLLKKLSMSIETTASLLMQHLATYLSSTAYSDQEKNTLMLWVLQQMEILAAEDRGFTAYLSQLAFVPTASGSRLSPCKLFDHTDRILRDLHLDNANAFAVEDFHKALETRKNSLGVRCRNDLTAQDLLEIMTLKSASPNNYSMKGEALLNVLDERPGLLTHVLSSGWLLKDRLSELAWFPRLIDRPSDYPEIMPWYEGDTMCKPSEMCPSSMALLVGASRPLFDIGRVNKLVQEAFCISSKDVISEVVQQLRLAIETWDKQEDKPSGMGLAMFVELLKCIYNEFSTKEAYVVQQLFSEAGVSDWVWHGTGFTSPQKLAFSTSFPTNILLNPHLYLVPDDFHYLRSFLLSFGVKDHFEDEDLLALLRSIKSNHDEMVGVDSTQVTQDLDCCRVILEWLVREGRTLSDEYRSKLYIPVQSSSNTLRLMPCNECTYCDRAFLRQGGSELSVTENFHLIHKHIPDSLAGSLGVPRLSRCLSGAEAMGFIEEAGQHEPLTTRLRNILDEYKEGVSIFKELIQNADDARAREVCFVMDWRDNYGERLLSPDMAKCQGPALWAYNNAQFSKKDFESINMLAGGTKKADLEKIGRFGLGFNAVYHLTDVPSFISGEYFVTFDPNMTHIQDIVGGKNARPGFKINLINKQHVLSQFPDQFLPYHGLFGCNTEPPTSTNSAPTSFPYAGTLFRFPLRTQQQANDSEISKRPCSREDISHMLQSLRTSAESLLLFAQNVKIVKVFQIAKGGDLVTGLSKPILAITKEINVVDSKGADTGETFLRNVSNWWKGHVKSKNAQTKKPNLCQTERVTMSVYVEKCELIGTDEAKKYTDTWLVNSCSGQHKSIALAASQEGQKNGLLPISGVALKINNMIENTEFITVSGEVFCFLPLSFTSGLPVHVNGNFAVLSNRRGLWTKGVGEHESLQPFEATWNGALMSDALVRAYVQLLEAIKRYAGTQYIFHSLWPDPGCVSGTWKPFIRSFFNTIIQENLPLFFCNNEWRPLQDCLILDEKLNEVDHCVDIMTRLGQNVLILPTCFMNGFRNSGQQDIITQQTLTEEKFLRRWFFPKVASLPSDMRNSVLCYVLQLRLNNHNEYDELFHNYPCFKCSNDEEVFRTPKEMVHPRGKVANLFSPDENRFPVEEIFLTVERSLMLQQLGMIKNHLTWDGICERAEWFSSRGVVERERAMFLIKYVTECLDASQAPSEQNTERLKAAKVFPFLGKPDNYPIAWKGSEISDPMSMFPAIDLYPRTLKNLVGYSQLIFDESAHSGNLSKLKRLLGLTSKQPNLDDVLNQLDGIIRHVNSSSSNAQHAAKNICAAIYDHFEKLCSDKKQKKKKFLRDELSRRPWILIKDKMVTSSIVAMSALRGLDCSPYLYRLPDNYKLSYPNLIKLCGVKGSFTSQDFHEAVGKMKTEAADGALSDEQLRILQAFLEEITTKTEDCVDSSLPLPDSDAVICDGETLVMNDAPWIQADATIHYVHPNIPHALAHKCGARRLVEAVVTDASEAMGQPFGQNECLTDRLKGILKSYPADEGILKELVQNADDAKASEIHFVYDPRNHGKERVFREEWRELCGPAICVYNNKTFSQADIQGIQKLGIGSKEDDPAKTGQYGIGFNAVYHFTDCPAFLSDDEVLCVSDPHLRYVPGASTEKPGRLFNQLDRRFRTNFQDVFSGFLGELFPLKGGTMFRFPLRSYPRPFQSKISSEVFYSTKVREIFDKFRVAAKEMMLFLNNIKEISISEIKDDKLVTYSVSCTVSDEETRINFSHKISQFKKTPTAKIPWHITHYVLTVSDTLDMKTSWLVCQALGSKNATSDQCAIPDGLKWGLLPRAGVAALLAGQSSNQHQLHPRAFCFLPLPVTTDLPVHVNGHFALDSSRRDLWHDTDSSQERTAWNEFVKGHVIAPTYAYLIDEARSHIPEIDDDDLGSFPSEQSAQNGLDWYHSLFPSVTNAGGWKTVEKALYLFLGNEGRKVLPVVQSVKPSKKVPEYQSKHRVITGPKDTSPPKPVHVLWDCVARVIFRHDEDDKLAETFLRLGLPLLAHTPSEVYNCFASCKSATRVSPAVVNDFLRNQSDLRCHLPANVKDTVLANYPSVAGLVEYCVKDKDFFEKLPDLPLLLTHDNVLRNFGEHSPVYSSDFADLLPGKPELFLHKHLKIFLHAHLEKASTFIREFNLSELSKFKTSIFPEDWERANTHYLWRTGEEDEKPRKEWVKLLWEFINEMTSSKEDKDGVVGSLDDLETWPIIPSLQGCLVPVTMSKTVLNQSSLIGRDDSASVKRRKVITSIGCAQLDSSLMPSRSTLTGGMLVRQHYLADIKSPKDVLGLLGFAMDQRNSDIQKEVSGDEILELLMFFQAGVSNLDSENLRKLPFYLTVNEQYICLSNTNKVYELPDDVPSKDCELLSRAVPCVFLRNKPQLRTLYKQTGIQQVTTVYFYAFIMFKHFESLSRNGRLCHLEFIREYLGSYFQKNDREQLTNALKQLRFIPTADGVLHQACDFYDDANKVFEAFEPKVRFPPQPFNQEEWRDFLRQVGLVTEVSQAKFEEYAQFVAREAANPTSSVAVEKIENMSNVLVTYLFNNESLNRHDENQHFLHRISKIKFVIAARLSDTSLLNILPAYGTSPRGDNVRYVQFSGSVISEHQTLLWSTAPVLSPKATPRLSEQSDLVKDLNILTTPPNNAVYSHIKNVANRFHNTEDKQIAEAQRTTVSWIMRTLYRYLEKCCPHKAPNTQPACSTECHEMVRVLRNIPFILIDESIFVRCDQLAFKRAHKSLEPHIFMVPRDLQQYQHFLKQLGAQEFVSPLQYSRVLLALKESCEDAVMHPGERRSVVKTTCGLFDSLHEKKFEASQSLEHVQDLYLPTEDWHLETSKRLLVNDCMEKKERLKQYLHRLLLDFSEPNKKRAEELVRLLPGRLQLKNLSSEVEHALSADCIKCLVNEGCEFIGRYRELLCSLEFSHGLVRLYKYQESKQKVPRDVEKDLKSMETCLTLTCMQSVTTRLVSITGETIGGTAKDESCFLQNVGETFKLFLKHGGDITSLSHSLAPFVYQV